MTSNRFELIIYIPTFNRYEKLKNCLDIISREILGLEDRVLVYVSNNGSTDGSKEYLQSLNYKWLDTRHNKENVGAALNVLHCFDLPIKSEFIWLVGDDDYLTPKSISGILLLIKEYPAADYIFCNTKAFSKQDSDEIMKNYFATGSVNGGAVKSCRYTGTALLDFEKLIDPGVADTLLGELMVHCFRQSRVRLDTRDAINFDHDAVNWDRVDFNTVGKLFVPHTLPFLSSFNGKTKAVYCDVPRTFNFWGSAEWLGEYDYIFPIIILFLISQYKERGFIYDDKYIKLLEYYYSIMGGSLTRQITGQSTARPFNSIIKATMFEFLFHYTNKHFKESQKNTAAVASLGESDRKKAAARPDKQLDRIIETKQKAPKSDSINIKPCPDVPLTSIIILTHNQLEHTQLCLQSIEQYTSLPYELILVDNGSTDGTLDYLSKYTNHRDNVRVIANKENLGFSAGNNQGLALANGNYLLLLNNDTVVTEGWLARMLSVFERYSDVGVVGPVSNYVSGPQQVKGAFYQNLEKMHQFAKQWSTEHMGKIIEYQRVVGFCLLAKREVIDRIGGLDEQFGSGNFEDDDFCLRAAAAGYKARIAQDAFIHHTGSQTFKGAGINYQQSLLRNWEIFKTKWKLPQDLPYGANYTLNLDTRDLSQYYIPLKGKTDILKADAVKEIPSLIHPEFNEGLTSIIILTHDRLEQTKKCVKSIRKHTPEPHEIIFVDNGSTDGTVKWLQGQVKENKNCRLIENQENVGLAKGRNQGINLSQGEFILLLDNDVVVSEGWLSGMLEYLNSATSAGIVGPMANKSTGLQQVTDDSYRSLDYLDKYAAKFKEQYRHRQIPCHNIAGFCMLFKRRLTEKIGLLDESFITGHFEDEDFCLRASLADYRNYIAGDVFVHHNGGKDSPGDRNSLEEKWVLNITSTEGKKLAVLKTTELADDLYQKGQTDQAAEVLINCIKLTPEAKEIYYELARMFIESKRFAEALEVVESMPESAMEELRGLEYAGYAKEGLGLDDEAAGYVEKMLSLNENYAPALNLKGVLAYKKDEKDEAADYFQEAINADPGYGEAYTNLGVLYWSMDNKDEALAHLRKGFVLSPTVPDVNSLYYSVVSSLGTHRDAEDVFREARGLYPNHKNITFLYIDALIQQGKFSVAMTEVEDAIALFGLDEGILAAALSVREKLGPRTPGGKDSKKATLSVCVIVKNEEEHLVKCLKSVRDVVDEMIVVDTGSTDKTKEIATVFGAQVFDFEWNDDFSAARNLSLSKAAGDWILVLDADEVISLLDHKRLLKTIARGNKRPVAFDIVTRNYLGKSGSAGWTENDGTYPNEERGIGWYGSNKVRLLRNNRLVRFENPVHELLEASLHKAGIPIEKCTIPIHHYGRLDQQKNITKGQEYYLLGRKKLEERGGGDFLALRELAVQATEIGKFEEAIDLWQQALALRPDTVEALFNLAYDFIQIGKYQEALQSAKRSVELSPGTMDALLNYALCEMLMGNVLKTTALLEESVSSKNENPSLMAVLGASYFISGDNDKGWAIFKKLAKKQVNSVVYVNDLLNKLIASGQIEYANLLIVAALSGNIADHETLRLRQELDASAK